MAKTLVWSFISSRQDDHKPKTWTKSENAGALHYQPFHTNLSTSLRTEQISQRLIFCHPDNDEGGGPMRLLSFVKVRVLIYVVGLCALWVSNVIKLVRCLKSNRSALTWLYLCGRMARMYQTLHHTQHLHISWQAFELCTTYTRSTVCTVTNKIQKTGSKVSRIFLFLCGTVCQYFAQTAGAPLAHAFFPPVWAVLTTSVHQVSAETTGYPIRSRRLYFAVTYLHHLVLLISTLMNRQEPVQMVWWQIKIQEQTWYFK